jgi:hypothetical protein
MEHQPHEIKVLLQQWIDQELPEADMVRELKDRGVPEDLVAELVADFKKHRADQRQRTGFILAGVGSLFCFISCLLTLLNPFPEYREFILYGITTLGVVIIFIGFYYIFEP